MLTPQTFLSGIRGKEDASLLPKINNKILTFKDFTTILQSHQQTQSDIFAQLREIYDGYYRKNFGTGASKEWKGKLGFIAGVTSVIDRQHNVHKSLGERFLQYRIKQPDRKEVMKRVRENTLKKQQMENELSMAFAAFMQSVKTPEKIPEINKEVNSRLEQVANFVSIARSAVLRGRYSKEIEFVPDFEMSTRIYSQMYVVALALSVINGSGSLTENDFKILFKLGFDSIHYLRRLAMEELRKYRSWVNTDKIATAISYSTPTTRQHLEDLFALKIAERIKPRNNLILWRLKDEYRENWSQCEWEPSIEDSILKDEKAEEDAQKNPEENTEEEPYDMDKDPEGLFDH